MSRDDILTALVQILPELGFADDDCVRLADFLDTLDTEWSAGRDLPSTLILRELLEIQGVQAATAGLMSRAIPQVNWHKLSATPRQAREILGVSNTTLMRYWHDGKLSPMLEHSSGALTVRLSVWWLHHLLYVLAWRMQHPQQFGQGATWWPEKID